MGPLILAWAGGLTLGLIAGNLAPPKVRPIAERTAVRLGLRQPDSPPAPPSTEVQIGEFEVKLEAARAELSAKRDSLKRELEGKERALGLMKQQRLDPESLRIQQEEIERYRRGLGQAEERLADVSRTLNDLRDARRDRRSPFDDDGQLDEWLVRAKNLLERSPWE
jgi:hypothetical protein